VASLLRPSGLRTNREEPGVPTYKLMAETGEDLGPFRGGALTWAPVTGSTTATTRSVFLDFDRLLEHGLGIFVGVLGSLVGCGGLDVLADNDDR
jgi:hypothetical protein